MADVDIFRDRFLPNIETHSRIDYNRWKAQNPNEASQFEAYRDKVLAGQAATPPSLATKYGKALVAAAEMAHETTAPEPEPEPTPGTWPASYTNGPLGTRNFLPPKGKVYLSIFPGSIGYDWNMQRTQIAQREQAMGRRYDMVAFANFPGVWPEKRIEWAASNGYIPYIAGWHFGTPVEQVAAGAVDSQINQMADYFKTQPKHMLRLFSEFDMPHVNYTSQGKEQAFVNAWKRVVDIFRQRGATNTGFFLCPTEGAGRATATKVLELMPNEYFDWVGTDAYNFQRVGSGGYSTPMHAGWAEFWELVQYPPGVSGTVSYSNRHDTWGPRKPFVLGEVNTIYDPNAPTKRADWFRNVLAAAKGLRQMEHCVGVTWYDADVSAAEGPDNNFLIDSRGNAIQGFVDMARDPIWLCRGSAGTALAAPEAAAQPVSAAVEDVSADEVEQSLSESFEVKDAAATDYSIEPSEK